MTPRSLLAPARLAGQPILRAQTDERLVDLVRAGCQPAFEAIVARYRRPLLRYCYRLVRDDRAEDVVQQALVSAYDAMLRSDAQIHLRPWLYRIAHNAALNALRDRGGRHEPLDDDTGRAALRTHGMADGAEQALERRQGFAETVAAVQALPSRQRDAIVLRELEGRSYEEIAGELGITGGAVRQLLNRARTTLRAGATAVTPVGLLVRVPWTSSEESVVRVAEIGATAGGGAAVAKVCATALVTGAVAGGVLVAPERDGGVDAGSSSEAAPAAPSGAGDALNALRDPGPSAPWDGRPEPDGDDEANDDRDRRDGRAGDRSGSGRHGAEGDRRGRGGGGDDDEDRSGPGGGGDRDDEEEDRSGPGGDDDHDDEDRSGPGGGYRGDDSNGSGGGRSGRDGSSSGESRLGSGGDSSGTSTSAGSVASGSDSLDSEEDDSEEDDSGEDDSGEDDSDD